MEEEQSRVILYYKDKYKSAQKKNSKNNQDSVERVCFEHRQIEEGLNKRIIELE